MLKHIPLLLHRKNRFIEDPPVLSLSACNTFCDDMHGTLIDGDLFDELEQKIDETFFEYEFGVKTCSHMKEKECSFLLNLNFDFEAQQWKNGITGTVFEDTRWFFQKNNSPNYPIMNDFLGNDIENEK